MSRTASIDGVTSPSARKGEIVALAGEMFATQGFATTTVRQIADAAGILSGSLYHHFDSKESIVEELLRGFLGDILAAYRGIIAETPEPRAALRALVQEAFDALHTHRAAVAVMLNEYNVLVGEPRFAFLHEGAEETEQLWAGVLESGIRSGAFRSDVDAHAIYRFMRDAIWVSVRWYRPGGSRSTADIADDYLAVLLGGISADAR